MSVDPLRHLSVFSPHAFGGRRVDVIGCGAVGSRVVLSLTKLGVGNIHAWDFDTIEEHNIANQVFGQKHIGWSKVEALAQIVREATEAKIEAHNERVDGSQSLGEVVFLLTDTMESRKEIWEKSLKFKLGVKLLIETRMGADSGRIYTLNPSQLSHIKAWEETLYADDEAEVSVCGASISVGPTAEIISGLAVWQMVRAFAIECGGEDELENEIMISLRQTFVMSRQF